MSHVIPNFDDYRNQPRPGTLESVNVGTNILYGRNGSGKSAILTAIGLCLGMSAHHTARGSKLASFIRDVSPEDPLNRCIISVVLHNSYGQNSTVVLQHGDTETSIQFRQRAEDKSRFKHNLYGDFIRVIRRISRTGVSSFTLWNHVENKKISGRKSDLSEILAHFGIMVKNPLTIMPQETVKRFLLNLTPTTQYAFFLKATLLELLFDLLAKIQTNIQKSNSQIQKIHTNLMQFKKVESDWKQQLAKRQHIFLHRDNITMLRVFMYWKRVEKTETQIYNCQLNIESLQNNHETAKKARSENINKIQEYRDAQKPLQEAQATFDAKVQLLRQRIDDAESRVQSATSLLSKTEDEIKRSKEKIQKFNAKKKYFEEQIRVLRAKVEETMARFAQKRTEKIQQLTAKLTQARSDAEKTNQIIANSSLDEQMQNVRNEESEKMAQLERIKTQIDRYKSDLESLQRGTGLRDSLSPALRKFTNLVAQQKWSSPVYGPLCTTIKFKSEANSELFDAAQHSFKARLHDFICTNHNDADKFRKLAANFTKSFNSNRRGQSYFRTPQIFAIRYNNNQPITLDQNDLPDSRFTTVMNMLEFPNTIVRDFLIIRAQIHAVIVMKASQTAYKMFTEPGSSWPRRVKKCFTADERLIRKQGSGISTSHQSFSKLIVTTSHGNQIKMISQKISHLDPQRNQLISEATVIKGKSSTLQQQRNNLTRKRNQCRIVIDDIETAIEEAKNDKSASKIQVSTQQEQARLNRLEELIATENRNLENIYPTMTKANQSLETASMELQDLDKSMKLFDSDERERNLAQQREITENLKEAETNRIAAEKLVNKAYQDLEQSHIEYKELTKKIVKHATDAKTKGERPCRHSTLKSLQERAALKKIWIDTGLISIRKKRSRGTGTDSQTQTHDEDSETESESDSESDSEEEEEEEEEPRSQPLLGNESGETGAESSQKSQSSNEVKIRIRDFRENDLPELVKMYKATNKVLEQLESNQEISTDNLIQNFENSKRQRKDEEKFLQRVEHMSQQMVESCNYREHFLDVQDNLTRQRARLLFSGPLRAQHFDGKLDFDKQAGTLKFWAKKSTEPSMREVRSLSGGERSLILSTYLRALWHIIMSPFCAIDEFDVFMDAKRRVGQLRDLANAAQSLSSTQFLFLTPQDISSLSGFRDTIRLLELTPPQRNE